MSSAHVRSAAPPPTSHAEVVTSLGNTICAIESLIEEGNESRSVVRALALLWAAHDELVASNDQIGPTVTVIP